MTYLPPLLILLTFALLVVAMVRNVLPAMLALPLMAVAMAVVAGVPPSEILQKVVEDGAYRLHAAYATVMFGAALSQIVQRAGIADAIVRRAAEFAGDRPVVVGSVMAVVTALLFTTLTGLGSVIMVAGIIFPILLAVGMPPLIAGSLFLVALNTGSLLNLANWQFFMSTFNLSQATMLSFSGLLLAVSVVILAVFIALEIGRYRGHGGIVGLLLIGIGAGLLATATIAGAVVGAAVLIGIAMHHWGGVSRLPFVVTAGVTAAAPQTTSKVPAAAYLTPILPVVLVVIFGIRNRFLPADAQFQFPLISAMVIGVLYGAFTCARPASGRVQLIAASLTEGIKDVAPAIAIMLGIGMVVNAASHPTVAAQLTPLLARLPIGHAVGYAVLFIALAPLALYRGPLNVWGLGSGLAVALVAAKVLPGAAIMGALLSVGVIQGTCDPTNTHNVWIAATLKLDPQQLMRKTLPYAWTAAAVGILIAAARYV